MRVKQRFLLLLSVVPERLLRAGGDGPNGARIRTPPVTSTAFTEGSLLASRLLANLQAGHSAASA